MARVIGRLTALQVVRQTAPGLYPDGAGLYLQVSRAGTKSWIWRYTLNGKTRDMGLGTLGAVPLAKARKAAADWRAVKDRGADPITERDASRRSERDKAASTIAFATCAREYIEAHRPSWKNAKHAQQWENTLRTYAGPIIGAMPVQAIDTAAVERVLKPLWASKPETASRLRGRIEAILDWAAVRHHRSGPNPARWRGNLQQLLPAKAKVQTVRHHPALPFDRMPSFMAELRVQDGIAAQALEFTILTLARTGETIGARPGEINRATKTWTVPPERMKVKREHRVPLSADALRITERLSPIATQFLFPGHKRGMHLSNMAMAKLLERMKHADITVHGFRSTFRDWAAERTNYAREVVEMALAHTIEDKVEAAYRRGDLFEKRRRLMNDWAKYCSQSAQVAGGKVVTMGQRRG